VLGDGIFISEGEKWRRQRRLMQPAFSRQSIERYAEVMVRRTAAARDRWHAAGRIDAVTETRRLALEIAVESLFGTDISDREARHIGVGVHVSSAQFQRRVSGRLSFLLSWLPTPGTLRTMLAIRRLNNLVDRIIRERRQHPAERHDLLSLLEAAADPETGSMTDRELRDEINTLLLAGHETTGLTLTWTLYELARHPEVDAELAAEVAQVVGPERLPEAADLGRLEVAGSIIRESLRLYPPLPVLAREALVDVELRGHALKAGSRVRAHMERTQRDPRFFDQPDEFRPERWRDGRERAVVRGSYLPFGAGPRMCIGSTFATMELVLALATIRQRYRWQLLSDDPPQPVARVALNPDRPIPLRLVAAPVAT
jgi:cytochrome P450